MSLLTLSSKRICSSIGDRPSAHRVHMQNQLKRIHKNRSSLSVSSCSNYFSWNKVTDGLVSGANIPFSILVLPQVFQNFKNMSSGNPHALSIISWEGYLSALLGNTLMCSHFADHGETNAVNVQLVGIANNMLVLAQMAWVSCMPMPIFVAVAAVVGLAVGMSIARVKGALAPDRSSQGGLNVWRKWQMLSGSFGLAAFMQVLYNLMKPGNNSLVPGMTSFALAVTYCGYITRSPGQPKLASSLPGWASTLLFAVSPLAQLVRNFMDARSLEGLSLGTLLLGLAGNALMAPRALLVEDTVWLAGTLWAIVTSWGQLLSMFVKVSPGTGSSFVSPPTFYAVSAVLATYMVYTWSRDSMAKTDKARSGGPSGDSSARAT